MIGSLVELLLRNASASEFIVESAKFGAYLTVIALMVSLPAFISIYINIRKTKLGRLLRQPLLAMFIGFFAIMINGIIHIAMIMTGHPVTNMDMVMGINRALAAVLISSGCVLLFFTSKNKGLFDIAYYKKKKPVRHKNKR